MQNRQHTRKIVIRKKTDGIYIQRKNDLKTTTIYENSDTTRSKLPIGPNNHKLKYLNYLPRFQLLHFKETSKRTVHTPNNLKSQSWTQKIHGRRLYWYNKILNASMCHLETACCSLTAIQTRRPWTRCKTDYGYLDTANELSCGTCQSGQRSAEGSPDPLFEKQRLCWSWKIHFHIWVCWNGSAFLKTLSLESKSFVRFGEYVNSELKRFSR